MHVEAHLGTASALDWHGDAESQGLLVTGPVVVVVVLVVGGAVVVATLVVDDVAAAVVLVVVASVVAGMAVATHEQTMPPADIALLRSVPWQEPITQPTAMEEMA
jgi:hypothetical protein